MHCSINTGLLCGSLRWRRSRAIAVPIVTNRCSSSLVRWSISMFTSTSALFLLPYLLCIFLIVKVELPWDQGVYRDSSTAGISCNTLGVYLDLIIIHKTVTLFPI